VASLKGKNWLARAWHSAFAPIREPQGFYRHRALVRLTHWINALCILILLGTGLNIFNAYPRLHWGRYGTDADQPFFSLGVNAVDGGPAEPAEAPRPAADRRRQGRPGGFRPPRAGSGAVGNRTAAVSSRS